MKDLEKLKQKHKKIICVIGDYSNDLPFPDLNDLKIFNDKSILEVVNYYYDTSELSEEEFNEEITYDFKEIEKINFFSIDYLDSINIFGSFIDY